MFLIVFQNNCFLSVSREKIINEKLTKITGNEIQQFEEQVKFIKSMRGTIPNLTISIQDLPNTVLRYINKPRKGVKLIDTLQQQGILSGN